MRILRNEYTPAMLRLLEAASWRRGKAPAISLASGVFLMLLLAPCISKAQVERTSTERFGRASAPRGGEGIEVQDELKPYTQTIPSTLIKLKMMPVPGGTVTLKTPDGPKEVQVEPFWMSKTEIPWEAYDVWVYGLDKKDGTSAADAISRPSKPYVLAGDEFGHNGYPALGMTRHAAAEFAQWLSLKTGKTYRLPTPAQWKHACLIGLEGEAQPEQLGAHAWHKANADEKTHPVASKQPNALGLYDLLGNAAELVAAPEGAPERTPVVRGGSFRSEAAEVSCTARVEQTPAWKATDPQLPKSQWWLSDAPFVGFRLVREPASSASR